MTSMHWFRRFNRRTRIFSLVGILVGLAASLDAAVPRRINYQGRLLDDNSNPRNGTYSMTFSIWDAGPTVDTGNQLWTETREVSVTNGIFTVQLGSINPLTSTVFEGIPRYLQIQIDDEIAGTRQRLLTSPYSFRSATSDDLSPGDDDYIQNTESLQDGATFYVSSGTISGSLVVGGTARIGTLEAGSAGHQVTTAAGLLDASKLTGTVPSAQVSGTYPAGTVGGLLPGDTDYLQNRDTLQSGATFYVAKGTVAGPFVATGAVTLGGTAGVSDVTVQGNLIVSGAGPHTFAGDLRINGNDLQDSGGTSRITLGSNLVMNGTLAAPSGTRGVLTSTSVYFSANANGDNFIAFPFTAGGTIADRDLVVISGANAVNTTTTAASQDAIGIAVSSGGAGDTVYVAMYGIVTGVVTNGPVATTNFVCSSTTAGRVDDSCNVNGAPIGKTLNGATGAGQTITMVLFQGR